MAKKLPIKKKPKRRAATLALPLTTNLVLITAMELQKARGVFAKQRTNAGRITATLVKAVEDAITARGKTVTLADFAEWRPELLKSVLKNLALGGVWDSATEAIVTSVATDMGTIAVILAGSNSAVAKDQIHAAFNAVSASHTTCAATTGSGAGSWCDFSM